MEKKYAFDKEHHIHTLGGKHLKGTTTVIKEVMPPMLSWYGSGQACKALGWYDRKQGRANYLPDEEGRPTLEKKLEEVKEMDADTYLKLLDKAYSAHNEYKKEKADWGTNAHAKIEKIVGEAIKNDGKLLESYEDEFVESFAKLNRDKKFIYSEKYLYSEKLWTGGITDLVYEKDGQYFISDLKTGKSIYESVFIQLGIYDALQSENGYFTADGEKVGDPLEISGYTVINIPQKGEGAIMTFYQVERMRSFASNLCELHSTLQELKEFVKN